MSHALTPSLSFSLALATVATALQKQSPLRSGAGASLCRLKFTSLILLLVLVLAGPWVPCVRVCLTGAFCLCNEFACDSFGLWRMNERSLFHTRSQPLIISWFSPAARQEGATNSNYILIQNAHLPHFHFHTLTSVFSAFSLSGSLTISHYSLQSGEPSGSSPQKYLKPQRSRSLGFERYYSAAFGSVRILKKPINTSAASHSKIFKNNCGCRYFLWKKKSCKQINRQICRGKSCAGIAARSLKFVSK